jgi:hypothetical protein
MKVMEDMRPAEGDPASGAIQVGQDPPAQALPQARAVSLAERIPEWTTSFGTDWSLSLSAEVAWREPNSHELKADKAWVQ